MIKYFVSYTYSLYSTTTTQFENTIIYSDQPISTDRDIKELTDYIKLKCGFNNVTIINFKELPNDSHDKSPTFSLK